MITIIKSNKGAILVSIFNIIICCTISTITLFCQTSSLRDKDSLEIVISDLKEYIPKRILEDKIPGLSIALIRDHKLVWEQGFGIKNRINKKEVSSSTIFDVASISKVITAYMALSLVDQELWSLDDPLDQLLEKKWLPKSESSNNMTLRHLLSHSSGLGDDVLFMNKDLRFEPGTEFLYSGIGYLYIQQLLQHLTNQSIDQLANSLLFEPLDMNSSSFVYKEFISAHSTNGHISAGFLFMLFLVPFILIFILISILGVLFNRINNTIWKYSKKLQWVTLFTSLLITEILIYIVIQKPFPNLVQANFIVGISFMIIMYLIFKLVKFLSEYFITTSQKTYLQNGVIVCVMLFMAILLVKSSESLLVPLPKNKSIHASAVGSLRSSAPDLAMFLIEMSNSKYLSQNIASQIPIKQIAINEDFSWGLGMGIQHSEHGDAIWQNGITFGFRHIMVIYPETGLGVVVLSNSNTGLSAVYDIAKRALGGKSNWNSF